MAVDIIINSCHKYYHCISRGTLKIDDCDVLGVILGKMFVRNLELVLDTKNVDHESLHQQVLLLPWIHTVTLRVQSESIEPIAIRDRHYVEDCLLIIRVISVALGEA